MGWYEERMTKMEAMIDDNASISEIADRFNISTFRVYDIIRAANRRSLAVANGRTFEVKGVQYVICK